MTEDAVTKGKEAAGRYAASQVEDGMQVGLGTGSTAYWAIVALGERQADIICVPTSKSTEELAAKYGMKVVEPGDVDRLDIDIDGADEVDNDHNLTKGGGAAHVREKVVANMADRFIVVVDEGKLVERLGMHHPLPVEVVPFARDVVKKNLLALGAHGVTVRDRISDNGNPILDADFARIDDPRALDTLLNATPGIVGHGIFLTDMVAEVVVGRSDGTCGAPDSGKDLNSEPLR